MKGIQDRRAAIEFLPSGAGSLAHYRLLLSLSAAVYLLWWFVVEALLPGSYNPLGSRLAISGSFLLVLSLSFFFAGVRRRIILLQSLCAYALTLHYFYLQLNNPGDSNWAVGSYITVVAVGATLEGFRFLFAFTLIVLSSSISIAVLDPQARLIFPGMVTILTLIHVIAYLRGKADQEKQKRVLAEARQSAVEASSRLKSIFLANVSHELRTPLTCIVGFTELLQEAEEFSPDSRDCLARISANARILTEKVEQLLTLNEDEVGQKQLHRESLSLKAVVLKEVEAAIAKTPSAAAISLRTEEASIDRVQGDGQRIAAVLRHILSNSVKFSHGGDIVVSLASRAIADGARVAVSIRVTDAGIGMKEDDRERVFDPFLQLQDSFSRPYGGVGLGLTVARKFARSMGGDVVIAGGAPGLGTTVRIDFNVDGPEAQANV